MNNKAGITNIKQELEISEQKRLRLRQQQIMQNFEPEDGSLWVMVDLMTLILVFFILLYANQVTTNSSPLPIKVPAIKKIMDMVIKKPELSTSSKPIENSIRIKKEFVKAMSQVNIKDYSIDIQKDRLVLTIGESISFSPGEDRLMNSIKKPLSKIAKLIRSQYTYQIIVSGHTDETPIHTQRFPSNWELSLARAMEVAKFLMAQGVDPHGIAVEGFGSYRPIADNLDALGRKANRRVEISLITQAL